ncbi:hypothetical protein GY45DRAFT_1331867 [Cubamyces sp. BRFM 1775]|nr:hypothetical protein GY45DRAFT_1331867 [Cubamyces sp. BRFM 1775]
MKHANARLVEVLHARALHSRPLPTAARSSRYPSRMDRYRLAHEPVPAGYCKQR